MTLIAPHYQKAKKNAVFAFFKKDRYLVKTPWWLKKFFPGCVWDGPKKEKTLYLTFDDGPHPTITPFVLEQLRKYNAKATFFCIGKNAKNFPRQYHQIINEGHMVGNHTMNHINGWECSDEEYSDDINRAKKYIKSNLFRPPYGRIKRSQIKWLTKDNNLPVANSRKHSIIMWNILAGDWDVNLQPEKCYERIKNKIANNDIIVFHDSEKAWDRMSYAVPRLLKDFTEKGYQFKVIG
jgi:peptidoglycan/xylan/chitin deacetylase (PgdA/CDA1 family)